MSSANSLSHEMESLKDGKEGFGMGLRDYLSHLIFRSIGTLSFFRRLEWSKIRDWLAVQDGEKVLDVACGQGQLGLKIAQKAYCEIYGVDVSQNSIARAEYRAKREGVAAKLQVADAQHLPYPDNYFDKIVCSSSLEHFLDDLEALHEMNRVIKPLGRIVLTTDSSLWQHDRMIAETHRQAARVINYYTIEDLRERLTSAGFSVSRTEYLLKSRIAGYLLRIGLERRWRGYLWMITSFLGYLPCVLAEKLSSNTHSGYTIIAEGRKPLNRLTY